jgi:hypothetical protein
MAALITRVQTTPDFESLLGEVLHGSFGLWWFYFELLADVEELLADPLFQGPCPDKGILLARKASL